MSVGYYSMFKFLEACSITTRIAYKKGLDHRFFEKTDAVNNLKIFGEGT